MRLTCDRNQLLEVISNVSRAVSPKSTLAALEGILLKAKNNILYISGYDLDLGMSASVEAKVTEPGELVLTAKLFVDMIHRMAGDIVSIENDEKLLTNIKCGLTEFTILGIPAEEFPDMPTITDSNELSLPQGMLKSMIGQTLFAIATSEAKPVHTGSLFQLEDHQLTVVSVDGFRLALRREVLAEGKDCAFVVPGKTLAEILKLLADNDDTMSLYLSNRHIIFDINGYSVVSRLLEGEFLDYKAAIPPASATVVSVNKRTFIESIERTSLLISDRLKSPLRIKFEDSTIKMSCSTAIGKAYDELGCNITGDGVEMGFNNRYLLDGLRAADCDEVHLIINGALSPMKIVPPQGEGFLFLVLPVRLKTE